MHFCFPFTKKTIIAQFLFYHRFALKSDANIKLIMYEYEEIQLDCISSIYSAGLLRILELSNNDNIKSIIS